MCVLLNAFKIVYVRAVVYSAACSFVLQGIVKYNFRTAQARGSRDEVPQKLKHIVIQSSTPAHIDNSVNFQRIFKIPSLAHSLENLG